MSRGLCKAIQLTNPNLGVLNESTIDPHLKAWHQPLVPGLINTRKKLFLRLLLSFSTLISSSCCFTLFRWLLLHRLNL